VDIFSAHSQPPISSAKVERQGYTPNGDRNMGARNAYHELGPKSASSFFASIPPKVPSRSDCPLFEAPQYISSGHRRRSGGRAQLACFFGFPGGRGEATTIGILLALIPESILIVAVPTIAVLLIKKNVILTSAVLFVSLLFVNWWLQVQGILVFYVLPCRSWWR